MLFFERLCTCLTYLSTELSSSGSVLPIAASSSAPDSPTSEIFPFVKSKVAPLSGERRRASAMWTWLRDVELKEVLLLAAL